MISLSSSGASSVAISLAQPGFARRCAKWRVSAAAGEVSPAADARSSAWRKEAAQGLCAVEYIRGPRAAALAAAAALARRVERAAGY